jgi:hypothetical protein
VGFQGTGLPTARTIQKQGIDNVSLAGPLFQYPTNGINSVRVQVENADPSNVVTVYGSVNGLSWFPVGTVSGNDAIVFPTIAYDFVKADVTTYGGTPFDASWKLETFPSAFGIVDQEGDQAQVENSRLLVESSLVDEDGNPYTDSNPVPISGSISVTVGGVASPQIINIPAPTLAEYTVAIPSATKTFNIKMRNSMGMRVAWSSGGTSSNYVTMQPGTVYSRENLVLNSILNVYVYPKVAGSVIELEYWT